MTANTIPLGTHLKRKAQDATFKRIHCGNLVYNTCWEDPRLDREMLQLGPESQLVMITSAGCNALDYLLDNPAQIHAIDVNPRQNALLQLKIAMIKRDHFGDLFQLFGRGHHNDFKRICKELEQILHPFASRYWQAKSYYFRNVPFNPSFYYRGTAGQMAWVALKTFVRGSGKLRQAARDFLEVDSLAEQQKLYSEIQPILWNKLVTWILKQPMSMAMLGVPAAQIRLIEEAFPGGIPGFLRSKIETVLTRIPFWENYFWQVYIRGEYTRDCCPNYLRQENQTILQERVEKITTHTSTIANFLRENPAAYSHYVLLDHQDWMAEHQPRALEEEWGLILENSRPGTRILMRSASPVIEFIPTFALDRLNLLEEEASRLHQLDRVGTYGCTLLATVKP